MSRFQWPKFVNLTNSIICAMLLYISYSNEMFLIMLFLSHVRWRRRRPPKCIEVSKTKTQAFCAWQFFLNTFRDEVRSYLKWNYLYRSCKWTSFYGGVFTGEWSSPLKINNSVAKGTFCHKSIGGAVSVATEIFVTNGFSGEIRYSNFSVHNISDWKTLIFQTIDI